MAGKQRVRGVLIARSSIPRPCTPAFCGCRISERRRQTQTTLYSSSLPRTEEGKCLKSWGHGKIREIDESSKNAKDFDPTIMLAAGESVTLA